MNLLPVVVPEQKTITMTLLSYSPPVQPKSDRIPPAGIRADKLQDWSEIIEENLPRHQEQIPAVRETPLQLPDIQPPDAHTRIAQPDKIESTQTVRKSPKPKRSLKALTRVISPVTESPRHRSQPRARETAADGQPVQTDPTKSRQGTNFQSPASNNAADNLAAVHQESPAPAIELARPLYRKNPPPRYPARARRKGLEGVVILEVLVDAVGGVGDLKISRSSGHSLLDRAALRAVRRWQFEPGRKDGKKVKMWVRLPIRFKLE